ncbi:MAG: diguanylate cyclase [Acidimicrobiales bacterium]
MHHDLDAALDGVLGEAVRSSPLIVLGISPDGTIRFANDTITVQLGYPLDDWVGHNVLDFVHPDDVERALLSTATLTTGMTLAEGVTRFSIRHADGTYGPVEVAASSAETDEGPLVVIWGRSLRTDVTIEELIHRLVSEPVVDVLRRVCDFVLWSSWGTQVGISWATAGRRHVVTTGMPESLASGAADGSPWDRARLTGEPHRGTIAELDPERRVAAERLGLEEVLVDPLEWGAAEPALITIWTVGGGRTPEHHAYGLHQMRAVAELVLRWSEQADELEAAARLDALTGLANRRTFYGVIDGGPGPGAVLYCDVDDFKAVNDTLGHTVGDVVLQEVADRLRRATRRGDLVARVGGDEFVIVCPGLDDADATALAARLRSALDEPIAIDGHPVPVGLSVGVAVAADGIDEATVEQADAELYRDKRRRSNQ